jgi:hypothetical protein
MKERFWKKKLASATEPRVWISGTLPRRVFYGATFFYLSFFAHWFVSRLPEPHVATPAAAERGMCEPLLDRFLGARRGT